MLALPWRKYSCDDFYIGGHKIQCIETTNDPRGTGLIVWDGAFVLAKYLEKRFGDTGLKGKVVCELGCGTGLGGISAASLGADIVYLTDLEYALHNTQANIDANPSLSSRLICAELDWTKPDLSFLSNAVVNYVLLADVAWIVELVPPLVATCVALANVSRNHPLEFILAHQTRSARTDEMLFGLLRDSGFRVQEISAADYAGGYDAVKLYRFSLPGGFQ